VGATAAVLGGGALVLTLISAGGRTSPVDIMFSIIAIATEKQ